MGADGKWFLRSKMFVAMLVVILSSFVGVPFVPPEWHPWIAGAAGVVGALDRALGGGGSPLTLLPGR